MRGIIIRSNSPFYYISYYDKRQKKSLKINTKIEVTEADRKRFEKRKNGEKAKCVGTPELRQLVAEFRLTLQKREIEKKLNTKLVRILKFSEGLEEYLIEKPHLKKNTISLYEYSASSWINNIGNKQIHNYSKADYKKYLEILEANNTKHATKHIITTRLSVLFNFFVEKGFCKQNIISKVPAPQYMPDPIPLADLQTILEFYKNKLAELKKAKYNFIPIDIVYQELFVQFQLYTGFRPSTTIKLTWDDINLTSGFILADNVKGKKKFMFPIHAYLEELLNRFPNKTGDLFPYKYAKMSFWDRDLKKLVIGGSIKKKYQLYQLRDTFSTMFADAGVDVLSVSELLNHSDPRVTTGSYLLPNVNRLKSLINGKQIFNNLE